MIDLKQRREKLGLTLEEVGQYVGVGKSTVRKWENGVINNMGRDKIAKYASILRISPLEFLYDITPENLIPVDNKKHCSHPNPRHYQMWPTNPGRGKHHQLPRRVVRPVAIWQFVLSSFSRRFHAPYYSRGEPSPHQRTANS